MTLKQTDKKIIDTISVIVGIAFLILMIVNFHLAIKIVSIILAVSYGLFIGLHIGLCFPTIMIGVGICDCIRYLFPNLEESSSVVFYTLFIILAIPTYLFVYIALPTFITMGCTGVYDFQEANKILLHGL